MSSILNHSARKLETNYGNKTGENTGTWRPHSRLPLRNQSMDDAEIKGENFLRLIQTKTIDPKSIGQNRDSSEGDPAAQACPRQQGKREINTLSSHLK